MLLFVAVWLVVATFTVNADDDLPVYPLDGAIHGFDVKFGEVRAPLVTYHYEEGNTWVNPYTRVAYAIPDEVLVMNSPNAELKANEDTFHNVTEFMHVQSEWHQVGIDVGLFGFAYAKDTGTIEKLFTENTAQVTLYRQNYGLYQVGSWPFQTLDRSDSKMDEFFDKMPTTCESDDDIGKWMDFIRLFGTHYVHHSDFGGSLNYYVSVDKYLVETYNEEWVHAQMSLYVRWANFNLGIGGGTNEDLQENDIDFIEHTIAETEWIGGSVESSSDDYSEWVASVEENPIMLYPVLHDLVETLPAGPRRDCFVSVSDKYLNTPEDPV
jgi:hypothetical protein